jgi:hypothetical protein
MAINATSRGIPISTIKAQAELLTVGSQGPYYLAEIISYLGANPKIRILEDGVLKYEDVINTTLTVTSNYIEIPTSFDEPPSTNVTDTLTGTCFLEIEKASDATVALIIPLSLPVDDPTEVKADISAALTSGIAVKANGLKLYAPVTLDVSSGSGYVTPPSTGIQRQLLSVNDAPVVVSSSLMGGSFHTHPDAPFGEQPFSYYGGTGAENAAPPFPIKVVGTHSRLGASWAGIINKGWTYYDTYKAWGNSFGAKVHFVLFQTPNELVDGTYSETNRYFPGLQSHAGAGPDLGNAPPVAGAVQTFITSLLNHDTTLETVEAWNEYEIYPTGYWQGTREQMARVMRECNAARLAVRPSVKILWPGMVNWDKLNPTVPFQNWVDANTGLAFASDGAGGQARDHIQGIGHHIYPYHTDSADTLAIYFLKVRASCDAMGKSALPKYLTEFGLTNGTITSASQAARVYGQCYLLAAIFGYQFANPWTMDMGRPSIGSGQGNWGGHVPWMTADFVNRHNQVAGLMGKTIRWAYVMTNNTITVGTNDGLVVTI